MKRAELSKALNYLAAGLVQQQLLPEHGYLHFSEDRIATYDGVMHLSVPNTTGFIGSIPGFPFRSVINSSRAKEVLFHRQGDELLIGLAKTRCRFTIAEYDVQAIQGSAESLGLGSAFVAGIRACMPSLGVNTWNKTLMGITVLFGEKSIVMYSTDNATMTRVDLAHAVPSELHGRIIQIGMPWCKHVVQDAYDDIEIGLQVIRGVTQDKRRELCGILCQDVDAQQYEDLMAGFPEFTESILITPEFVRAVERAKAFTAHADRVELRPGENTELQVIGGFVQLRTGGPFGELLDRAPGNSKHTEIKVNLSAASLARLLPDMTSMAVVRGCLALFGSGCQRYLMTWV